nr:RNA-directed DNA polymerase, eukaryota [Tanacetum cinerariifolium]
MENSKKSLVSVLKRGSQSHVTPEITKPALVLDETCIKEFDFGMSLIGRAKDVSAVPNLPCIISKEGFQNVKLSYLGRMQKVIIQGKVYWIRVKELDAWFSNFQEDDQDDLSSDGESQEGDVANKADNNESDVDRVSESCFMHKTKLLTKMSTVAKKESDEPKFLPGFTPDNNDQEKTVDENIKDTTERIQSLSNKLNDRCSNRGFSSQQSIGNKAKRRWINKLCQQHRINFASIQETKAESISLQTIKDLWGNQMFDHVVGSSVGCSGGYAFTWAHKSASNMSKLDRYLISEGVLDLFPHLSALCLDRHLSDHRPILLREKNYDYGPSSFRFFHSWFAMKGFNSFVETTWKSLNIVEPNGLIRLKKKLQALKIAIKVWSKEANKRSNDRKINIQQNLSEAEKLIDQGKSNDEILIKRITLFNDLQELNNRNAIEISQKAKIRWSIEGDENSKYFYGIMNKKRSQLAIRGAFANREWISEPHRVKNEFFTHFKKQFSLIQAPSICFDFTFPTRLFSDQVQDLERTVTYEEVKRAVWDCGTNKSPGPDGFSFEFYRKYWTTIDDDVNFEKAFDSVKWDYLDETLKAFGFGSKWRNWISSCLNNAMESVLINGSPTLKFQFHKGLKQGDPISPSLFILIMKTLYLTFKIVSNDDLYKGISLNESFTISHLFYADDIIFIGEWNNNNIQTLLSVLRCFYLPSGFKINLHKSKLIEIGVSSNVVAAVASLIGCSILTAPFNYLGVKVGCNMSRITSWDDVISKSKKVGNGENTSFWNDSWLGEVALKVLYKRSYALEMCKSISVAEKMSHPSLSHSFRRMPRGSQEFSVKSSRILIDNTILPKAEVPTRWLRVVPIKVNVHAWRVCLDKLPTRANISLREMDIPSIACPLCNSAVESSSHIFFARPLARQVWRKFLIWWELEDVAFNSYNEWLNWIVNIRLHKQLKVFLE